jgi:hypothetical protein
MSEKAQVIAFEEALTAISQLPMEQQKSILGQVLMVFDDRCKQIDVMWGLVHYVDSLLNEGYVTILIQKTPELLSQADQWLTILYLRLLSERTFPIVSENLNKLPDATSVSVKNFLVSLITKEIREAANEERQNMLKVFLTRINSTHK